MPPLPAAQRLPGADYEGFASAIFALRAEVTADLGPADKWYLYRVIAVNRLFTVLGYLTAWLCPNPLSAYFISQGLSGRWIEMHHLGHGGFDDVPGMPKYLHSKRYALGWRRYIDWFDWILPAAWNHEHNVLHHHYTSELIDPDLVEEHAEFMRNARWPRWVKYLLVGILAITWKFTYYAPNTLRVYERRPQASMDGKLPFWQRLFRDGMDLRRLPVRRLWFQCYLPYASVAFVIIPLLFYFTPFGWWAVFSVLVNRLLAEAIANAHAFLMVGPNHTGDDLYRFAGHFEDRNAFCVHQVISSANYNTGTLVGDYLQGWLNYQIEHHLFPRLPMGRLSQLQPRVKALCHQHGIPYVQENCFKRLHQMVRVIVGAGSLKQLPLAAPGAADGATPAAAPGPDAVVA